MNIHVEVSTPFFHENNTAAIHSYAFVEPLAPLATSEPLASCNQESEANKNTVFYAVQSSLFYTAYNRQYNERCRNSLGNPDCKTIMNHLVREDEKLEMIKAIMMPHVRPMRHAKDTNPVPWRWENRMEVPVEERGACLLYHPETNQHTFCKTSLCLLHENDVVDNGTVMCLQSDMYTCLYGNETMKAMIEVDTIYRSPLQPPKIVEIAPTTWFIAFVIICLIDAALRKCR